MFQNARQAVWGALRELWTTKDPHSRLNYICKQVISLLDPSIVVNVKIGLAADLPTLCVCRVCPFVTRVLFLSRNIWHSDVFSTLRLRWNPHRHFAGHWDWYEFPIETFWAIQMGFTCPLSHWFSSKFDPHIHFCPGELRCTEYLWRSEVAVGFREKCSIECNQTSLHIALRGILGTILTPFNFIRTRLWTLDLSGGSSLQVYNCTLKWTPHPNMSLYLHVSVVGSFWTD